MTLLASFGVTNRMDVALLYAPAILYAFYRVRSFTAVGVVLLASTPFLLWEAFALFYYGFPFPNTAYAKLGTGIGRPGNGACRVCTISGSPSRLIP